MTKKVEREEKIQRGVREKEPESKNKEKKMKRRRTLVEGASILELRMKKS